MKYLFIIFCLLLFIFACQSDSFDEINNSEGASAYGKAVYGKAVYGKARYKGIK